MLKGRTTLKLALVAVMLGTVLWSVRRHDDSVAGELSGRTVFGAGLDNADRLVVRRGQLEIECQRIKGRWQIVRPFRTSADGRRIEALLDRISLVELQDTITPEQRAKRELTLDSFGLQSSTGRVVVASRQMRYEMLIGDLTPLRDGVYARLGGSPNVVVCSPDLLDLLPDDLDDLRQHRLLGGDPAHVVRIEMYAPGEPFTRIIREGREWRITEPVEGLADQGAVEHVLNVLLFAQVREFLWDPVDGGSESRASRALAYHVTREEAQVSVQLWDAGQRTGREVLLGMPLEGSESLVAAVRSDVPGIVAMDASLVDELLVPVSALRDPRLWLIPGDSVNEFALIGPEEHVRFSREEGQWQMTEPVRVSADSEMIDDLLARILGMQAAGYVSGTSTNLDLYGLDRSLCTVELKSRAGEVQRLSLGGSAGLGDLAYVKFDDSDEVIRARTVRVPELATRDWDPRDYRDKSILRIPAHKVTFIRLELAGLDPHEVRPDEKGEWQTTAPLPAVLDREALTAVLELLSDLRALRVEELVVRDPMAFGMGEPWATLTVGVENDDAINRVLLVGRRSAEGGRYAMLRGGDVLFVLSPEQISVLQSALVRKPM